MTRSQIVALLLGASVVAVGAGLAWRAHLFNALETQPLPFAAVSPAPAPQHGIEKHAMQAASAAPQVPVAPVAPQHSPAPHSPAQHAEALAARPPSAAVPAAPQFDTVRVEPSGDTVVAGHGAPDAKVALVAGGKVLAEAAADSAGNFVMVPPPLRPGNYELTLRSELPQKPPVVSVQNVTVSVPQKGKKDVVVALAEPGKPSVVLADTAAKPVPPTAPTHVPQLRFESAETDKGAFYATGTAKPGARLNIYLNNAPIAGVTAASDGHWSLTIKKGLTPGHYALRADAVAVSRKVTARAEVPFDVPVEGGPTKIKPPSAVAAANAPALQPDRAEPESEPAVPGASDAVVAQLATTTVIRGDSLWRISRKIFGHGVRYTLIYEANAEQIRDPDLIYPGQVFVLPQDK